MARADIGPEERKRATEEASLDAAPTREVIRREGSKERERSPSALAEATLRIHQPDAPRLAHVIVGSAEVPALVFAGKLSYGAFLASCFLPVLLGDTTGGVTLVAAVNHALATSGGG